MVRQILLVTSSILATAGGLIAVLGVLNEGFKNVIIGVLLISTAGVFATLYLGTRGT